MRSWESVCHGKLSGSDSHGRMDHPKKELTAKRLTLG
jgi:hypothetical protein